MESGVLVNLLERMGWVYGRILGGVRFWHDLWCGHETLKEAFSNFIWYWLCKECFCCGSREFFGGAIEWNVSF